MRATYLELRPAALSHNLELVREKAPGSQLCAMVKSDGYGHGLVLAARAFAKADRLGVAVMAEACAIRAAGITTPITVVEGFFDVEEVAQAVALGDVACIVHSRWQVDLLQSIALDPRHNDLHKTLLETPLEVWPVHDSGMHRLGMSAEQLQAQCVRLMAMSQVNVTTIMTHLACADMADDALSERQIAPCLALADTLGLAASIGNSAGLWRYAASRTQLVRPGIILYGASPFAHLSAATMGLKVTQSLSARLIAINAIAAEEAVGYGSRWRSRRPSRMGVVAIGYGDGYPRHAPDGTPVAVATANGMQRCSIAGRVSMDMLTIDLTDIPAAQVGDRVELWGDTISIDEVATCCDTISYELFCRLTQRPERIIK